LRWSSKVQYKKGGKDSQVFGKKSTAIYNELKRPRMVLATLGGSRATTTKKALRARQVERHLSRVSIGKGGFLEERRRDLEEENGG